MRLKFLPTLIRELTGPRTLQREPEPDLIMDNDEQVASYAEAGRINGVMSAAYLFHSAQATQVIGGRARVLDLGCGPATQLGQIAALNPDTEFTGLDFSETMLADAQRHVQSLGLTNVSFRRGDMTRLEGIEDASFDGVISTMALHHLPAPSEPGLAGTSLLEQCFSEIRRVLKPDGAVYLTDFTRLKSVRSVIDFAYINADAQPYLFTLDYERSLRAAFLLEEFEQTRARFLPPNTKTYNTHLVPLLMVIQTPPSPLSAAVKTEIQRLRDAIPKRYRPDLAELRQFFRWNGHPMDPFA